MNGSETGADGFRLSPQQELALAAGAGPSQCAVMLDGPVDVEALERALATVAARHEILRTTFAQPAGMRVAQQVISEDPARAFELRTAPATDGDPATGPELVALMSAEAELPFDLEAGPLLRAAVSGSGDDGAALVVTACGACADAASLLILVGELCAAYSSAAAADEPIQYADYAEWRHDLVSDEESDVQEGLAHWRGDAADRPARPRILGASQTPGERPATAAVALDLAEIRLEDVQRAAVGAGATVPVVLEAAWHALLARLTGASEVLIASWCDGRTQPDLASAIGAFAQPAPVRSRVAEGTTFAEVVDQVRRARATAVRWQDCAGGDDLAALCRQAAAGLAVHEVRALPAPARGVAMLRPAPPPAPLALNLCAGADELGGSLAYDPAAFSLKDAEELARRYRALLASALDDPARPIDELHLMDDSERAGLLAAAAGPPRGRDARPLVHERLAEVAGTFPDRPAVVGPSGSLSYAELDAAANRLANHLAEVSEMERRPVGLCMERTPQMMVALMGIMRAGGAYLPLNYEHPRARIAHQLRDAGAGVVIAEEHLLGSLEGLEATVVCVDRDAAAIASASADPPGVRAGAEDLAYVMYTSGSSGAPKGVAVTHGNLAAYAAAVAERLFGAGDGDADEGPVFGVVSAISTDLANTSIFPPLVVAGCVRLISAEASIDGTLVGAELAGAHLDVLKIAPSHLRAMLAAGAVEVLPRRWLVVGGEALSWELVEQVRAQSPDCRIINHYGPTETTVGCTTYEVDAAQRPDSLTVPIGFPLAGVRAYVLDRRLQPAPRGTPGELCIAGDGVALGYVGAGGGEESGFIADPFAPDSRPGRMYRTGDRVRMLGDGAIEFLGRLDDQVKVRGFRIEPGEIETALLGDQDIRQAAVAVEDDGHGGARLIAYIVAPEAPGAQQVRAFLAQSLPDHMIPSAFRSVEALPLTASGKIDRQALFGLAELQSKRDADYVAPRDDVEQQIAEIWGELLGVERVGALDDFFALGGHSLLATQATLRIRRLYGDVPLRALLAAPTVAALADVIRATRAEPPAAGRAAGSAVQ